RREVLAAMGDVRAHGQRLMLRAFAAADLRPDLPGIGIPTLILHGADDARSPRAVAEDLHRRIPGSRLILLDGVGHVANMEAQQRWDEAARAFFASTA
ncbi:MAG: alpha/beta fold hydrolase, partial [Thermoleophilia bacterium]